MKLYTSYFYQIRNFPKTLIPLSTAIWDPKWYHANGESSKLFLDKRGVLNGMKIKELVPGPTCSDQCSGIEKCSTKDPTKCTFLSNYRQQLDKLDFKEFIKNLYELSDALSKINKVDYIDFALIFHESPDNPCSERWVIQEWLKDNNFPVQEFDLSTTI